MTNSIYGTPMTGIQSANFELGIIANNIANVNTGGYQEVEAQLASLPAQGPIGGSAGMPPSPQVTHVVMGAHAAGTIRNETAAPLQETGNPLDLAIQGPGYFALRDANNTPVYARQVTLHIDGSGQVVTEQGLVPTPPLRVPADVVHLTVDAHGAVTGETRGGAPRLLGRLQTVTFAAPENLRAQGGSLYAESLGSGRAQPQTVVQAQVLTGYKLGSNVDLATQMTSIIEAQHMYEANTKALQTLDQLVNTAVTLQSR